LWYQVSLHYQSLAGLLPVGPPPAVHSITQPAQLEETANLMTQTLYTKEK